MKRDRHISVTRDSRVTSQVRVTRDITALSRVSHATTTTPHHTSSLVASSRGVRGSDFHPSLQSVEPASPSRTARRLSPMDEEMFGGGL